MIFYYNDDALNKEFRAVFRRACEVWAEGSGGKLKFSYIDRSFDASNSTIYVKLVKNLPDVVVGQGLPGSNPNENNYLYLNGNLQFGTVLDTEWFSSLKRLWSKGYDLLSVCEHELGHIFGLEHNDHYNSIMQPNYLNLPKKPSKDDFKELIKVLHLD